MPLIGTLIVDDEPLARRRIRQLLADFPDFEVLGECASGAEALHVLTQTPGPVPDLVFLDVQMPDMDGLEVARQLPALARPLVVFVTAYDHYPLQAFEAHAVDYLLKPLDPDRFARCLAHIRHRVGQQRASAAPPAASFAEQLLIKQPGRLYFVPTEEVAYLEAAGNYVTVHAQGTPHAPRAAGHAQPARPAARPRAVSAHPPLPDCEHPARAGAAPLDARRVPAHPARRHAPYLVAQLQRRRSAVYSRAQPVAS